MDYLFPVKDGVITTGFYDRRPYSKPIAERTNFHCGWDIAVKHGMPAEIVAPEDGDLYLHLIHRSSNDKTASFNWLNGVWYIFSNFFYDNYGCCTILRGKSGKTYMFAHQDEPEFFALAFDYFTADKLTLRWFNKKSYNDWVQALLTIDRPVPVKQGDPVGTIGNSGYSTNDHLHMQIHADYADYNSRIDPAELWPDVAINDNGDGPLKGAKPGVIGVMG